MGLKVICLHRFVGRGYLLHTSSLFPQQEGKTHPSATEKIEDCGGRKEDLEGDCLRLFFFRGCTIYCRDKISFGLLNKLPISS